MLRAAAELGYRPNQLAKAMKSGSTHTIGVVLPDVASPFFSAVLRGISEAARAAHFEVLVSNTGNDAGIEARSVDLLAEKRVDGIVIAPVLQEQSTPLAGLFDDGLPIVLVDRRLPNLAQVPLCSLDHSAATEIAIEELLTHNHTRIAIVSEAADEIERLNRIARLEDRDVTVLRPSEQRLIGYIRALHRNNVALDRSLVRRAGYSAAEADIAVTELLADPQGATALHCTDEALTYGAYQAFVRAGVLPPEQLSFVGFDDQDWTTLMRPPVTIVHQATHELGMAAARMLVEQLTSGTPADDTFFAASLLSRGSVSTARG